MVVVDVDVVEALTLVLVVDCARAVLATLAPTRARIANVEIADVGRRLRIEATTASVAHCARLSSSGASRDSRIDATAGHGDDDDRDHDGRIEGERRVR